jgi:hypothetical protein
MQKQQDRQAIKTELRNQLQLRGTAKLLEWIEHESALLLLTEILIEETKREHSRLISPKRATLAVAAILLVLAAITNSTILWAGMGFVLVMLIPAFASAPINDEWRFSHKHKSVWVNAKAELLKRLSEPISEAAVSPLFELLICLNSIKFREETELESVLISQLGHALPYLSTNAAQKLSEGCRQYLAASIQERTSADPPQRQDTENSFVIAALLTLAAARDPRATSARVLAARDRNEKVREAALDYMNAL